MKKIIAPAIAVIFLAAGCSSAPEAEVKAETRPVQTVAEITVPADAPVDLPEFVEIPAVEAQIEEAPYVEVTPEAYVFDAVPVQVEAPVYAVEAAEVVETEEVAPEFIYEEAVKAPECWQDDSCYVDLSPQEWVRHLTGDTSLVVHTWEGELPTGCSTLLTAICVIDNAPDDDSVSYYMSQTVVGKAGWVPQIMSVLGY